MKIFFVPVMLVMALAVLAQNQNWLEIQPIRTVKETGVVGDVYSHVIASDIHKDSDLVTSVHETTHMLNARLRIKLKKKNAYYVLNNMVFVIDNPNVTLKQVANAVPLNERGKLYKLYLVEQQQYWNESPLYVLDEAVAYMNGCYAGIDIQDGKRTVESYNNAMEMLNYATEAQDLIIEKTDFHDKVALAEFIKYIYNRLEVVRAISVYKGWLQDH